jgi:hypothetical protein
MHSSNSSLSLSKSYLLHFVLLSCCVFSAATSGGGGGMMVIEAATSGGGGGMMVIEAEDGEVWPMGAGGGGEAVCAPSSADGAVLRVGMIGNKSLLSCGGRMEARIGEDEMGGWMTTGIALVMDAGGSRAVSGVVRNGSRGGELELCVGRMKRGGGGDGEEEGRNATCQPVDAASLQRCGTVRAEMAV